MPSPIIECVPNFSEGKDKAVIDAIADAIRSVDGAKLLDVDPGASTNRTVYTFAGAPEAVLEAAFCAAKVGTELIDMRRHKGEHPRFGALDVCPIVPIAGCTLKDCVEWSKQLAKRLGDELGLTIYLYAESANKPERRDLSNVRSGEYEGLAAKLVHSDWKPDYGPATFNERSGATAVGARKILIAYNINLNTTSTRRANAVAFDVRERGRVKRIGDPLTGEIARDENGDPIYEPGALKSVKGIGWYIEEYGICQVSMNLTDIEQTPIHVAFDETVEKAAARGIRVTGSELVGLIPLDALLDAGRYFLRKQQRSTGVSDSELIKIAIRSMGLDELTPFDPKKKIIEYALLEPNQNRLTDMSVREFVEETASESPAPGGGSISAAMGAFGAALATMVANLSSHKRGWDDRWQEFSDWAERGKNYYQQLLELIELDTAAFDGLMAAFGLPKSTDEEKSIRAARIAEATRKAIEVPLETMRTAFASMEVIEAMAKIGNPNSVSDAGVGAIAARGAVLGAELNVKINCAGFADRDFAEAALAEATRISEAVRAREAEIMALVESRMG